VPKGFRLLPTYQENNMHPFDVQRDIKSFGYTFTYWQLRNLGVSRLESLWLIWVARNINC
jgi:hypothetical protein